MATAPRDENNVPVKLGVSCVDGTTLIPIAIDGNGKMLTDSTTSISFTPTQVAPRDDNFVPAWLAQSSVDGTPCPIYVTEDGKVLID